MRRLCGVFQSIRYIVINTLTSIRHISVIGKLELFAYMSSSEELIGRQYL